MPFIPHTEADVRDMLGAIGAQSLNDLFSEIPAELRCGKLTAVPEGLSEMEVSQLMRTRAKLDGVALNFIGAGAYEHHIPAAVWEITTRGEFYSAYTPYQAEASQGTLQLLYEFQSMMTALTGLDVSNASMYDGASALAEAVLMAERASPNARRRVLVPRTVNPVYRSVLKALVTAQNIELVEVDYARDGADAGRISAATLMALKTDPFTSLIVPQPNYFGMLEDVDALTDWAHAQGALVIGLVNPVALAVLKAPGQWGTSGADIAVGEGQPLGAPLASGGPYFGFMTAKKEFVRQMPGRIVGRTLDLDGKPGFTLTLQAREQHIRRSKATSNICTNQGLLVTAATIHMALLGAEGLARVASSAMHNLARLTTALGSIAGVETVFEGPHFHERVLQLPRPATAVLEKLAGLGVLGGADLSRDYPELGQSILVCTTETKTESHIATYQRALAAVLAAN